MERRVRVLLSVLLSWAPIATKVQAFAPQKYRTGTATSSCMSATKIQVDAYVNPNRPTGEVICHDGITNDIIKYHPDLNEENEQKERVVAAGVGSGVLGMMIAGPIGGVALGFSAAYAAETKEGVVGDSARAVGDVALSARNKANEIDDKHHLVDASLKAAKEAWEKAEELDREHKILQKAKDVTIYGATSTVDFVREHNLVGRGAHGIVKGISWLSERVSEGSLSPVDDLAGKTAISSPDETTVYHGWPTGRQQMPLRQGTVPPVQQIPPAETGAHRPHSCMTADDAVLRPDLRC